MVRGGPLLSPLHNWWCDIRHNCHKNHRGRGASLSSQRGGKIVFKDFFSRRGGGSLTGRNFSSLIFNGKRILLGVWMTLKIFYPVGVFVIARNLHTTIQSWKLIRRKTWYNYSTLPISCLQQPCNTDSLLILFLAERQKTQPDLTCDAWKMIRNKSGILGKPRNVNVVLIWEIINDPLKASLVFRQPETISL